MIVNLLRVSDHGDGPLRISSAVLDFTVDALTQQPLCSFTIEGRDSNAFQGLVDSAANAIFVSPGFIADNGLQVRTLSKPKEVVLADNTLSSQGKVHTYCDLTLRFNPVCAAKFRCYVATIPYAAILGGPVWALKPQVDHRSGTCTFPGEPEGPAPQAADPPGGECFTRPGEDHN